MGLRKTQTESILEGMRSKVDPEKEYSATEIQQLGLLPWKDSRVIARILASGLLKAKVSGKNTQKRYIVKGSEIIKFNATHGAAVMAVKPKQRYGKRKSKRRSKTRRT